MPELPEVETIARTLRQGGQPQRNVPLLGKTFSAVDVHWERTIAEPEPAAFATRLVGQKIEEIGRRAKYLVLRLSRDSLLIHLRMSGDLSVTENGSAAKHERVVFHLDKSLRLVFNDARKFGRIWLVADPAAVLGRLGPEPLASDFSAAAFGQMLKTHHRLLKPLLLDQAFLAGLGNIYTDESLHLARLHPCRTADSLNEAEAGQLWAAIRTTLTEGIRRNGASIDWAYRGGSFQNEFRVYQRAGQPCPVCAHPIERWVVAQRGTHFCPVCQPPAG